MPKSARLKENLCTGGISAVTSAPRTKWSAGQCSQQGQQGESGQPYGAVDLPSARPKIVALMTEGFMMGSLSHQI